MPLPAYLLERLKKRKLILEEKSEPTKSNDNLEKSQIKPTEKGESSGQSNYEFNKDSSNIRENLVEEIIAEDYSDSGDEACDGAEEESDRSGESDDDNEGGTDNDDDNNQSDEEEDIEGRLISDNDTGDQSNNDNNQEDRLLVPQATESVLGCPNKYNIYHECSGYCQDKYGSLPKDLAPSLEQRKQLALLLRTFPMTSDWSIVYDPGVRTFYFWNIITNQVSWFPPGMTSFASPSADQIRRLMRENH